MVAESDYDFVVKAAKKFNFEFFSIGGNVAFRKAKANTQELAEIYPCKMIIDYNISYDITGLAGEVKVRTLDIGKATKIEVKKKNNATFSIGGKAKPLISSQSYVYIDSSIETQKDAESRAEYLLEDMAYRLGSLRMTFVGLPEFVPGRFVVLKDFGEGISNKYYITDVIHSYPDEGKFVTVLVGKAATI
jgi:phage protein D